MTIPLGYLSEVLTEPFGVRCRILQAGRHEGARGKWIIFLRISTSSGAFTRLVVKTFRTAAEHDSEQEGLRVASEAGLLVPTSYANSSTPDNPLGAPFVIMSRLSGRELAKTGDDPPAHEFLSRLQSDLSKLYSIRTTAEKGRGPRLEPKRLHSYTAECVSALELRGELRSALVLNRLLEDLTAWREAHGSALSEYPASYIHGDLYPGNLLVTDEGQIGFIDWAGSGWGDVAEDIGYLTVRTLPWVASDVRATSASLVKHLERHLEDDTLSHRCHHYQAAFVIHTCYLALMHWERRDVVERLLAKCIPELA